MKFSQEWVGKPVPVGRDLGLPAAFTNRWEFPEDHTVEIDVAVENGVPVCNAVRVMRNPGRSPLTGAELRRLPIGNWVEFACREAAMRAESAGQGHTKLRPVREDEVDDVSEQIGAVVDRRRRITDDLLGEVAEVYLLADRGELAVGPHEAVKDRFFVSDSQAFKYVKLAREKGLLPTKDAGT